MSLLLMQGPWAIIPVYQCIQTVAFLPGHKGHQVTTDTIPRTKTRHHNGEKLFISEVLVEWTNRGRTLLWFVLLPFLYLYPSNSLLVLQYLHVFCKYIPVLRQQGHRLAVCDHLSAFAGQGLGQQIAVGSMERPVFHKWWLIVKIETERKRLPTNCTHNESFK